MAYYPRFHVKNAYDTRIPTAINAMRHLFNLITLAEDENQKNNLVKAYDAVADQFLDMTKDIPEKNGIKTLGKDIKYFANGLVRSPEGAIIAKPFEYESFKGTTVTPKYNIFPKNRECGHYRYTRPTCTTSLLMKSYLKYKLTGKLTSGKLVKIPELYDKIQTLLNEFTFDETLPLDVYVKFIQKYAKCYIEIKDEYMSLYKSIIHTHDFENDYNSILRVLYGDTGYYGSTSDVLTSKESVMPKLFGIRNITTEKTLYERRNTYGYNQNNSRILTFEYIPYLSEEDTNKFVELYNKVFNEKFETLVNESNATTSTYGTSVDYIASNSEDYAQQLCYEFYKQMEKKANSRKFSKIPSFAKYGHKLLLIEPTSELTEHDTQYSHIAAKESIIISNTNISLIVNTTTCNDDRLYREHIYDNLSTLDRLQTNICSDLKNKYLYDSGLNKHNCTVADKEKEMEKLMKKAEHVAKEIFTNFINNNKNDIDMTIEHIKESLCIIADNLLDINATFFDIDNQDFTNFLIRKKVISDKLLDRLSSEPVPGTIDDTNDIEVVEIATE